MSCDACKINATGPPAGPRKGAAARPSPSPFPPIRPYNGQMPYIEKNGCIYRFGRTGYIRMTNFLARIVEEAVRRDGSGRTTVIAYKVEARHKNPRIPRQVVTVAAMWFHRVPWARMLVPGYIVEPGAQGHLSVAVKWLSGMTMAGPVPQVEAAPLQEDR
jgi:hypothetical protein